MNKYIKKLLESLFDNETNIVDDDNVISDIVMSETLSSLYKKYPNNKTEYPEGFYEIDLAEQYAKLGYNLCNDIDPEPQWCYFKCNFKDYDNSLKYNSIEVYTNIGYLLKHMYTIYLDNYHIHSIQFVTYGDFPDRNYLSFHYKSRERSIALMSFFRLFLIIKNTDSNYIIDEINIGIDTNTENNDENWSYYIKELKNACEIDFTSFMNTKIKNKKQIPITTEFINEFPTINIITDNGLQPISKAYKQKTISFMNPSILVDNNTTLYNLLMYFKQLGFNKIKPNFYINVQDETSEFKGMNNIHDIYAYFYVANNIDRFQFTKKDKLEIINYLIENPVSSYLEDNYDIHRTLYTLFNSSFGDKGKDKHGTYIIADISFSLSSALKEKTDKQQYLNFFYKFYKSGYFELIKIEIYDSELNTTNVKIEEKYKKGAVEV